MSDLEQQLEQDVEHVEEGVSDFFEDATPDEYNAKGKLISSVPVPQELGVALGLLLIIFGTAYLSLPEKDVEQPATTDYYIEEEITPEKATRPARLDIFDDVAVRAHSAFVWDVKNQKPLFSKNPDDIRPLASVTKLMTALVAYELMSPEDRVSITNYAIKTEGDSGLLEGETFTMEDLADLTLVSSSNDGATALGATAAEGITDGYHPNEVFVKAMNIKAQELGLTKTTFRNSTGLDMSETEPGAEGTAREMTLLMEHIILNNPDSVALTAYDEARIRSLEGDDHTSKNTNRSVNEIDGLIASKTGYTVLAGGNLVIAFNAGLDRPIIVSVLGSSYNERFSDTLTLVEKTKEYINQE